jgi:dTDP-4-dehydrorhamnose 3,5-epimerase
MSRFTVTDTRLAGLKAVQRHARGDARGSLTRVFCADELAGAGWVEAIAQINLTETSQRGTVRGLHFQHPPHAETKLVQCLRGEVWDVAIDLRRGSPTFLHWHAQELSPDNGMALLIPKGFAHGFQALTDNVQMLYCHSTRYAREAEAGLNPLDPRLAIAWPLPPAMISARDLAHPTIDAAFTGVEV